MRGVLRFILGLVAFITCCLLATAGAAYLLIKEGVLPVQPPQWRTLQQASQASLPPQPLKEAPELLRNMVFVSESGHEEPLVSRASTPLAEYLYVKAVAQLTMEEGPKAHIQVLGRSSYCPTGFNPLLRKSQGWTSDFTGSSSTGVRWCIAIAPGSQVGYRTFTGAWQGLRGPLEADYDVQYLAFIAPDGRAGALKVTAFALCDEDKGCGHFSSVQLGIDDAAVDEIAQPELGDFEPVRITADAGPVRPVAAKELRGAAVNGYLLAQLPPAP